MGSRKRIYPGHFHAATQAHNGTPFRNSNEGWDKKNFEAYCALFKVHVPDELGRECRLFESQEKQYSYTLYVSPLAIRVPKVFWHTFYCVP
jgi:hypothetical protein